MNPKDANGNTIQVGHLAVRAGTNNPYKVVDIRDSKQVVCQDRDGRRSLMWGFDLIITNP